MCLSPTLSVQYWKIWAKQCCATNDNVIKKTGLVASYKAAKGRSRMIKDMWLVANLAIVTELWKLRNKVYFEDVVVQWSGFKGRVYQVIRENSIRIKGYMYNTLDDLRILNCFRVQYRSCKISLPKEVTWNPPNQDEIMLCCDGASFGNPGQVGAGVVFRYANAAVLGARSVSLGWQTNFYAEVCAIIYGVMLAKRWNVRNICVKSDLMNCIQAFQKGELPWQLRQKWRMAKEFYNNIHYIQKYREVNFSDDALAKRACLLAEDTFEFYEGRPVFLLSVECPGEFYFRFK
ncbi:uncharacterized protein LOC113346399 [Papaver somniferum]|uniref:uncharacterized protein LOC113346399 n=1 Tax=Papaver somniferum TaxID=3469 RepID=UPI000E7022D2|nr:uncharacterized protein LOC113346399 [Papaver somniferum]